VRVRGRPVAVALALAVTLVAVALALAGCGSPAVSTPTAASTPGTSASASASATTEPSTPGTSASASASPSQAESTSPPISPGLSSSVPGVDVVIDPALLEALPAAVGEARVEIEPGSFGEAVRDPSFVANVDAAAFAIVTEGDDLASGVVANLRSDVFSDAFFRDWRDSYDEGACGQAGGVAGNAESDLGGRTVYIGTCVGGLRTYHAWLEERNVIISLFAIGEGRFGERLMSDLRP